MGKLIYRSQIDPYFNNVELLLHMNGANGSTIFIDHSKNNSVITVNGNAQINTAQSKFEGSSAYFDGSSAINIPTSLIQFDAGQNFTVECWVRLSSYGFKGVIGADTYGTFNITINPSSEVGVSRSNQAQLIASSTLINLNQWYHIAVTRDNGIIKLFTDGQLDGSYTDDTIFSAPDDLQIGHLANEESWWFEGYIDELRITKGIARYTSNFVPQNKEFYDGKIIKNISIKKQNLTSLKVGGGTTVNNPSSVYVFKGGSINTLADIFNPINFQVNDTIFITSLELFLNEDYDFLFQVDDYGAGKYWTNDIYAQTNMNNYVIPVNYIIYFNTSNNNNIQVSNGAIIQKYNSGRLRIY